jgi:AcrR family transcriptional regulator
MNFKNSDRRSNRTRKSLQDALISLILEKRYAKVTVQDVIERANVGRSTYYAHFIDINDLLSSLFDGLREVLDQRLKDCSTSGVDPWEITLLMFQHASDQRWLYKAMIGERGSNVMLAHIKKYFTGVIQEHLNGHLSGRKDEMIPLEILTFYIANSFMELITWWLDRDLPYTAERMNNIFQQLVEHGLESVLGPMEAMPV